MSLETAEIIATLSGAWTRQIVPYNEHIHCLYLEEGLTGFVTILDKPEIGLFNGQKCVLIPLSTWIMLNTLASATVTPFRIVAKGKGLIAKGWMPHTGLKYPVRKSTIGPATLYVPVSEFEAIK